MVDIKTTLSTARTIAVVGCSTDPRRPSHGIARYLQQVGYRMIPVNPNHREVHGETCYPDLQSVPADVQIDIVNIFRHPRFTALMIHNTIERVRQTGEKPVIWTQLGVSSAEAEQLAEEAGLPYIRNRCIIVEHSRLLG